MGREGFEGMPRSKGHRTSSRPATRMALFTRNLFRYPAMLGAVVPCSPFLINDMLAVVSWKRARVLVEYGPGIGNISEEILKRMARTPAKGGERHYDTIRV